MYETVGIASKSFRGFARHDAVQKVSISDLPPNVLYMMLAKVRFNNLNIKNMSTIGLKEIAELNDGLAYLFNALEHNDESEHSEKIDKAISLLNEVATDLICHCSVPKAAIPISQNKCEKCGKRLLISYCG